MDYAEFLKRKQFDDVAAGFQCERLNERLFPFQRAVVRWALARGRAAILAYELWSNPGDLILSPFAGIGSEGVVALRMGRRFVGSELKPSYWRVAVKNLQAERRQQQSLFEVA